MRIEVGLMIAVLCGALCACSSARLVSSASQSPTPDRVEILNGRGQVIGTVTSVGVMAEADSYAIPGVGTVRMVPPGCSLYGSTDSGFHAFLSERCSIRMLEAEFVCFDEVKLVDARTQGVMIIRGCAPFDEYWEGRMRSLPALGYCFDSGLPLVYDPRLKALMKGNEILETWARELQSE